uniref:uncharacterized protein LOC143309061 n=1 Tax=Arvicanthis niloticus TaxID=61156 RepID=UPI00402BF046
MDVGGRHRQSSHLSLQPGVADAREGRGPEAGTGTPDLRESASWDAPPVGLANSQPPLRAAPGRGNRVSLLAPGSSARPPEARALGPQKGRRAHGAALTALCSPAQPARPLAPRPPPPRPPQRSPGQIQRRRARGRGLGDGRGGKGRCKCYNFLRCPRPGGPGTRRGEGSARAPMSSLSFSPPRAPPRASRPAPPTSSTGQNPRFSVPGVGGWRRRERKEKRERLAAQHCPCHTWFAVGAGKTLPPSRTLPLWIPDTEELTEMTLTAIVQTLEQPAHLLKSSGVKEGNKTRGRKNIQEPEKRGKLRRERPSRSVPVSMVL